MTDEQARAVLRTMIAEEDTLRDQRLGWLFALNGLLFTAIGFAWSDPHSGPLVIALGLLGILASLSVKASLLGSDLALCNLKDDAKKLEPDGLPLTGASSDDLRKLGGLYHYAPCVYPWKAMPWFLCLAWIAVVIGRVTR